MFEIDYEEARREAMDARREADTEAVLALVPDVLSEAVEEAAEFLNQIESEAEGDAEAIREDLAGMYFGCSVEITRYGPDVDISFFATSDSHLIDNVDPPTTIAEARAFIAGCDSVAHELCRLQMQEGGPAYARMDLEDLQDY